MSGVPASSRSFNGGTITEPLVIAVADGNRIPFSLRSSWNAQNVNFLSVVNTDTGIEMVAVNASGALVAADHATGALLGQFGSSSALGNSVVLQSGSDLGFFGHAVAPQQAGVAVTAAGIHAALVALGLITA